MFRNRRRSPQSLRGGTSKNKGESRKRVGVVGLWRRATSLRDLHRSTEAESDISVAERPHHHLNKDIITSTNRASKNHHDGDDDDDVAQDNVAALVWLAQLIDNEDQRMRQHTILTTSISRARRHRLPRFAPVGDASFDLSTLRRGLDHPIERRLGARIEHVMSHVTALDLTGHDLDHFPAELLRLTSLQNLCLTDNRIGELPPGIGRLDRLERLVLRNNRLKALPLELGSLRHLRELCVCGNFIDQVPTAVGQTYRLPELRPLPCAKSHEAKGNLKLVVIGDLESGKTDMVVTFIQGKSPRKHRASGIASAYSSTLTPRGQAHDRVTNVSVYDTSGQEEFENIRVMSYDKADVFIVTYSVIDPPSFHSIREVWWPEIHGLYPEVPVVLVGTNCGRREDKKTLRKLKLQSQRPVRIEEALALAVDMEAVAYFECDTTQSGSVREVFEACAGIRLALERDAASEQRSDDDAPGGCLPFLFRSSSGSPSARRKATSQVAVDVKGLLSSSVPTEDIQAWNETRLEAERQRRRGEQGMMCYYQSRQRPALDSKKAEPPHGHDHESKGKEKVHDKPERKERQRPHRAKREAKKRTSEDEVVEKNGSTSEEGQRLPPPPPRRRSLQKLMMLEAVQQSPLRPYSPAPALPEPPVQPVKRVGWANT